MYYTNEQLRTEECIPYVVLEVDISENHTDEKLRRPYWVKLKDGGDGKK